MTDIKVDYWFPTPIWICDLDLDNIAIKNSCFNYKEKDPEGRTLSNRGGWQSKDLTLQNSDENLYKLITTINSKATEILNVDYAQNDRCAVVDNYWININCKNDYNIMHSHPGSFLSGVYYVDVPENSGLIHFERDSHEIFMLASQGLCGKSIVSGTNCEYTPIVGRLLLFPGWVNHTVLPNKSDEYRISIAFNCTPKKMSFGGFV